MNILLKKMINQSDMIKNLIKNPILKPIRNQNGSMIVIALMILVTITIIGLVSSDSVVTEQFILRNQGIYKQNVNMVEGVIMEGLQFFMQRPPDDQNIIDIAGSNIINDIKSPLATNTWYAIDPPARILTAGINLIPIAVVPQTLTDRGENLANNLTAAFVGWNIVNLPGGGSESLGVGVNKPIWRQGRLMAEYLSTNNRYGVLRMEIGVKRRLVPN